MFGARKESRLGPMRAVAAIALLMLSGVGGAMPAASTGAPDNLVVRWNSVVLEAIRNSTLGPPMVARALATVHTCMYDAWAAYDPLAAGTRYGSALRRPKGERTEGNKAEAISYAAHRAARDLFPQRRKQLDAFLAALGYDPNLEPSGTTSPAGLGATACAAVLAYRHEDRANQTAMLSRESYSDWTGYRPTDAPMVVSQPIDPDTVVDPNKWQPLTYPNRQGRIVTPNYLGPHWGSVQPFALRSGSAHRSLTGPARYGSASFASQAAELLEISANLTDRQKASAEYWADGPNSETPPGHWSLFAQFVSRRDQHTVDQDVMMFFAVTNAGMDAGIAAWDAKRAFDSVRPITALRYLYRGKQIRAWAGPGRDAQLIDGGSWRPYQPVWFPTPPFPEYLSGHSTFSASAAEVLKQFTGSDVFGGSATVRAGSSFVEPGTTPHADQVLRWPTFSAAADEAGLSRRYGGIHFEQGDLDGRKLGRLVGGQVWLRAKLCFTGVCR